MRILKQLTALLVIGLALLAGCTPQPAPEVSQKKPDWLMVSAEQTRSSDLLLVTVALSSPADLKELGLTLQSEHQLELVAEWPLQAIKIHCLVFRSPTDRQVADVLAALRKDGRVKTAEPMYEYRTLALRAGDDYSGLQLSLKAMDVFSAHGIATGKGVKIGIVDTGIDPAHPDLEGTVSLWKDFTGASTPDPVAEVHGTAMAGIVAAEAGSGRGIVGVAPDASLLGLRGCWQEETAGRCSSFTLARAINFAILKEVDVLNLSLTGPEDPVLQQLLEEAARRNIFIVAADRGNSFPASMPEVIGVVQQAGDGNPPSELVAPSHDILSTAPGGVYDFFTGSSVASAHIAGVAALLKQVRPDAGYGEIAAALRAATPFGAGTANSEAPNVCLAMQRICSGSQASGAPACQAVRRCGQG